MLWIEVFLTIIVCLCIGAIYTICGYKVTNLFTDGPKWKPWEQALFWLVWPITIPIFLFAALILILVAIFVLIFITVVTCYDLIKSIIKKLSR